MVVVLSSRISAVAEVFVAEVAAGIVDAAFVVVAVVVDDVAAGAVETVAVTMDCSDSPLMWTVPVWLTVAHGSVWWYRLL